MQLPESLRLAEKKVTGLEILLHGTHLRGALRSAHMPVSAEDYLRTVRLNVAATTGFFIALFLVFAFTGYELDLFGITTSMMVFWILAFGVVVPGVYIFHMYYPVILARGRKSRIDLDLPYAISYMQALSTTMPPFEIMRRIYREGDMFGEVSNEFGMVVRDVELFGDDMITAMRNLQNTTPSANLRDFLNDLGIVFDSGGDISSYLGAKTEYYREQAKQELELVLKTIEIMAEVYVSAFVAGPIALIIMIVAQGMTNSQGMNWILPLMYVIIPVGAIVMVWILSIMLPPENMDVSRREVIEQDFGSGIPSEDVPPSAEEAARDQVFFKRIESRKRMNLLKASLRNPLRTYITNYDYSLIAATIVAGIMAGLWYTGWMKSLFPHNGFEAFLCVLIIGFMVPVVIAYEGRRWYVRNVEAHLPEFLRELSDMKDIGITLQEAIHRISGARLGVLSSELSVASRDIEAGAYVNTALVRMEARIGLVSVKRAISLLVRASEITTNLRQIFIIAITDLEHYLRLKSERANTTIVYVMIIYLSFGIYLYTAYQLNVPFLSSFKGHNLSISLDSAGNLTEMFRIGIILATFSGIMAGQFSSNSVLAGFKHSIVLLAAALALFVFLM
ncbi:type II secretion system F family protein [Methanoregula sp.]|uniref:type II secretion system F family protein n=1 Tax=Methanoregula sp. TaxID=2052170 RepID=UPI003563CF8D